MEIDVDRCNRAALAGGDTPAAAALAKRAEAWRPWRAYAAVHLWTSRIVNRASD